MTNPYQTPAAAEDPDLTRPDFHIIRQSNWVLGFITFCGLIQVGCCTFLIWQKPLGWAPYLCAGLGLLNPIVQIFLQCYFVRRKLQFLPAVLRGEALCAGDAYFNARFWWRGGALILTQRELIFIRGATRDWNSGQELRFPLNDIAEEIRSSRGTPLTFTAPLTGKRIKLFVSNRRAWQKAILQATDSPLSNLVS